MGSCPQFDQPKLNANCRTPINHVHEEFAERAHQTSAKYDEKISEFEACDFQEEYLNGFIAPFVKESKIRIAMKFLEEIHIETNNTLLIIGEITDIYLPEQCIEESGNVDLNAVHDVCISGLNTYHSVDRMASFKYAKPELTSGFSR